MDTTEQLHFDFSLSCIGEGNGNPLQYSCLEDPRDGGTWWAAIYGVAQSWTRLKRLSSSSNGDLKENTHQPLGWGTGSNASYLENCLKTGDSSCPLLPGKIASTASQTVLLLLMCVCLVTQSCPPLCDPMGCSPPGSSVHGDSPGKSTEVGCHFLLQGIFLTQGSRIVGRLFTL